jgi:hypothetical protein
MTEIISHCGTKIKTTTIKDHDVIQTKYEMVELFATNHYLCARSTISSMSMSIIHIKVKNIDFMIL